jgi:hypothetical protein
MGARPFEVGAYWKFKSFFFSSPTTPKTNAVAHMHRVLLARLLSLSATSLVEK